MNATKYDKRQNNGYKTQNFYKNGNFEPGLCLNYNPRHICWDNTPSLPFNVGKNWKKHKSFIARVIRSIFNATLGGGGGEENARMIEQLNENLSLSVPTNYDADCSYMCQSDVLDK